MVVGVVGVEQRAVSSTTDCMSTGCRRIALRPNREYTSRSSISRDIRRAEVVITLM